MATLPLVNQRILRHFAVSPRLSLSSGLGLAVYFLLPEAWRTVTKLLPTWNSGGLLYLILVAV
jgi:hypothetical protein